MDDAPQQVIACAEAGLWGYVPSDASMADLARAARRVAFGQMVCSVGMGDKLFHHLRSAAQRNPSCATDAALTARQQQILQLINQGLSNKQIAQRLSLGNIDCQNHVHGLLGRLHVGRRSRSSGAYRQCHWSGTYSGDGGMQASAVSHSGIGYPITQQHIPKTGKLAAGMFGKLQGNVVPGRRVAQ